MSIVTKTGDKGETGLLYGQRVPKNHPIIHAVGSIDELNVALGFVKHKISDDNDKDKIHQIQTTLFAVMGEVACDKSDLEKFKKSKFDKLTPANLQLIEDWIEQIEPQVDLKDWAVPGDNEIGLYCDLARVTCRRAERDLIGLDTNPAIIQYINRISDLLWLLARYYKNKF
jgi:cob(I)alamin adenosyltransferase